MTWTPLALLLGLLACTDPPPPEGPGPGAATDHPPPPPPPPPPPVLALAEAPALAALPDVPLSALLTVAGTLPSRLTVTVADDRGGGFTVRWPTLAQRHEVPVLGLKPARRHTVTVSLSDEAGTALDAGVLAFDTPPLPEAFPHVDVLAHDPVRAEPGYRLANVELHAPGAGRWLVAWDVSDLEVAWLYAGEPDFDDVRRTPAGDLIGLQGGVPAEMDLLGRSLRRWRPVPGPGELPLPVDNVHHELVLLDDGSLLTLSETTHRAEAYPTSYDTPRLREGPADITASAVVRFAADGSPISSWNLAERLDDGRIGFDSLDPWIRGFDWDHTNAVIPHPDGGVIVSVRHQDVLIRLDADGDLVWILGDPAGWDPPWSDHLLAPAGPLTWPYHAHAPALDADGLLVVFDNHNFGHTPYTPPPVGGTSARVVAYRVDEAAGTVAEVWSFAPDGPALRSDVLGDADPLPGGTVLATFGLITAEDGVSNLALGRSLRSVRLVEFDPAAPSPTALDLRLWTPPERGDGGVRTYRAEALPSLYPDDVVVEHR